jgi:hypothetical protein
MGWALKLAEAPVRIFSGGGGFGHRLGGVSVRRFPWWSVFGGYAVGVGAGAAAAKRHAFSRKPQRYPWFQGLIACVVVVMGLMVAAGGAERWGDPTSLQQIAQIDPADPYHLDLVTVTGTVRAKVEDQATAGNLFPTYVYLLTNDDESLGLIVRRWDWRNIEVGSRATMTGSLDDSLAFDSDFRTHWVSWAQEVLPKGRVIQGIELRATTPLPTIVIPIGIAIAVFGVWIFAAALAGYAVFLPVRGARPSGGAMPVSPAGVFLSGRLPDNYGRDIRLRDQSASISQSRDHANDRATIKCEGFPDVEVEAGTGCQARAGTSFVLRAARPALSVVDTTGRRVTIAFGDETMRDGWLGLINSGS